MNIKLLNRTNESLLHDFLNKNKNKQVSYSLQFRDAIEASYLNCKSFYFLVFEGQKVVGFLPFILIKSKIFGNRLISSPFLDVGGFLGKFDKGCIDEAISYVTKLEKLKYVEVRMNKSMSGFESCKKILKKSQFVDNPEKHQLIVDLTSKEDMWKRFHKHTRNDYRMSKKSGLVLSKIDSLKKLNQFYKLYICQMKTFGSPPHSKKYFINLFELGKDSIFSGFNCYKDNAIAGSIIILYYGKNGYVAFNVSNPDFRDCRPNDFLYWNVIKECIKNKLTRLDLGQVELDLKFGTRARGLYKFKIKWLGKTYERNYFRYNPQGVIEISGKSKLKKLRGIWKLLPLWAIKLVGPKICSELGT